MVSKKKKTHFDYDIHFMYNDIHFLNYRIYEKIY